MPLPLSHSLGVTLERTEQLLVGLLCLCFSRLLFRRKQCPHSEQQEGTDAKTTCKVGHFKVQKAATFIAVPEEKGGAIEDLQNDDAFHSSVTISVHLFLYHQAPYFGAIPILNRTSRSRPSAVTWHLAPTVGCRLRTTVG